MRPIVLRVLGRASFHFPSCMEKHPASSTQVFHKNVFIHITTMLLSQLIFWPVWLLCFGCFPQTQFHGDKETRITVALGLDILQWYHSPSPVPDRIIYFPHTYSFPAKYLWPFTCICFNTGGNLAFRFSDEPVGLNSPFYSCVEAPSAFWPSYHREPVGSVVGQCFLGMNHIISSYTFDLGN